MPISNLQALHNSGSKWSLAEDRQLCDVMDEISSSLSAKINDTTCAIEEKALKIANTCVHLSNLNNRLSSYASDQFIENKVSDETVGFAKRYITSRAANVNKQLEVTENLRLAVSMGLELMRTRFKRIDMRPEDFDEDDDPTFMPEPIFEPYDENLSRPLPFLIGSSEWKSSSCVETSDQRAEITKISEEVIISLPPFAEQRAPVPTDQFQSDSLAEIAVYGTSSETISRASSGFDGFGTKIGNDSHEHSSRIQKEEVSVAYVSQSLQKEAESIKVTESVPDSSTKDILRQSFETTKGTTASEVSTEQNTTTGNVTGRFEKGVISEVVINGSSELFPDGSDEDDLFSDSRNASLKPESHCAHTYITESKTTLKIEPDNICLKKTDDNIVCIPSLSDQITQSKKEVLRNDDADSSNTERAKTNAFRNKLDSILSHKVLPGTVNGVDKRQSKINEDDIHTALDDEENTVLPSLAKLRAKGPPRRSPSGVSHQLNRENNEKKEVNTIPDAVITTCVNSDDMVQNAHKNAHIPKGSKVESKHCNYEKPNQNAINNVKTKSRSDVIFASSSDEDGDNDGIFSTPKLTKSKNSVTDFRKWSSQDKVAQKIQPISVAKNKSDFAVPQVTQNEFAKMGSKLRNIFDSDDDEDIFAQSVEQKKEQQQKQEKKSNKSIPKRVDIFGDDSDDYDLFT